MNIDRAGLNAPLLELMYGGMDTVIAAELTVAAGWSIENLELSEKRTDTLFVGSNPDPETVITLNGVPELWLKDEIEGVPDALPPLPDPPPPFCGAPQERQTAIPISTERLRTELPKWVIFMFDYSAT